MRILWAGLGGVSLALGLAGVVLPLLPATPFFLLAAFGFARSSPRLHDWLVFHPRFGPAIRDWQAHGAISRGAKRLAVLAILVTFAISLALGLSAQLLVVQSAILALVTLFILTRPDGPSRRDD
jgi:uncharacterized protein